MGGSVAPPAKASESAPTNLGSAGLLPGGFFLLVIRRSRALPEGCGPVSNFFVFLLFVSFFHFSGKDSFFQDDIRQNLADARHSAPSILGQNSTFRHCRWSPTATFVHQRDTQKRR